MLKTSKMTFLVGSWGFHRISDKVMVFNHFYLPRWLLSKVKSKKLGCIENLLY